MMLNRYVTALLLIVASVSIAWADSGLSHGEKSRKDRYTIYFDAYATTPNYDSVKALESLKEQIKKKPPVRIAIEGHADREENKKTSDGPLKYKRTLSNMRAEYVSRWLKTGTKTSAKIITSAFGDSRPVNFSRTPLAGKQNRRVEVRLYSTAAAAAEVTAPPSGKHPKVTIPEKVHEFDEVLEDTKVIHDFVIKNTGEGTLNILKVNPG